MEAIEGIELLIEKVPTNLQWDLEDWTTQEFEENNILFYQGKNYIPKDYKLQWEITSQFHEKITVGHPGEIETLNAIKEHYWWPGMRSFIKNYVKGCGICQQLKINQNPLNPSYIPIPGPANTRLFANCSMDMIMDLPPITLDNGTIIDAVMIMVDHGLTKGVVLTPCAKNLMHKGAGDILLNHVYKCFGLPDSIISDRDPWFTAKSFQELLKLLWVKSKLTTAYHPQSDGTTEHFNQEIEAYIGIYCSSNRETWHKFIGNYQWHSDRQRTFFELMYGFSPLAILTSFENTKFRSVDDQIKQLQKDREKAGAAHELAWRRMAEHQKNKFTRFKLGQLVWLDTQNIKNNYHKKIAPKREGPFKIIEILGPLNYCLQLPSTWKLHNNFHAIFLIPYTENEVHGPNFLRPPPDIEDNKEWWEVKAILKHQKQGQGYWYYVLWKGYPITEALWELVMCFENGAENILQDYWHWHHL